MGAFLGDTIPWASIAHGDVAFGLGFVCVARSAWSMFLSWRAAQSPDAVEPSLMTLSGWVYCFERS